MGVENIIVAHVKPWGPQRVWSSRQQAQKLNLMSPCIAFAELLMDWIMSLQITMKTEISSVVQPVLHKQLSNAQRKK